MQGSACVQRNGHRLLARKLGIWCAVSTLKVEASTDAGRPSLNKAVDLAPLGPGKECRARRRQRPTFSATEPPPPFGDEQPPKLREGEEATETIQQLLRRVACGIFHSKTPPQGCRAASAGEHHDVVGFARGRASQRGG